MSDLLAPVLLIMEDEIEAFWCFTGLMSKLVSKKPYLSCIVLLFNDSISLKISDLLSQSSVKKCVHETPFR